MSLRTLSITLVLILGSLTVALPSASADESAGKNWRILFDDATMEEPATDSVYNAQPNGAAFYLGDVGATLRLRVCNDHATDAATNVVMRIASNDAIFTRLATATTTTPERTVANIAAGACSVNAATGFEFVLDLANSGAIGKHVMWFNLTWERSGSSDNLVGVPFELYVSSIFDPVAGDFDSHVLPRLVETSPLAPGGPGNTFFRAGQTFQPASMTLTSALAAAVENLEVELVSLGATGVAATGGKTKAFVPTAGPGLLANQPTWRIDVAGMPPPGVYDAALAFKYVRNPNTATSATIIETGAATKFTIDFTPVVVAELPAPVTIDQGQFTTFPVRFRNVGNAPLTGLVVEAAADGPAGDFFFSPATHYENAAPAGVKRHTIGTLAVDAASDNVDVTVSHILLLPGGEHRLAFRWNAWMFDDGVNRVNPGSAWMRMGGFMTNHDANTRTPEIGQLYRDVNEDGVFLAPDTVLPGPWPGAFVTLTVADPAGPTVLATVAGAMTTADVTNVPFAVSLANQERFALLETTARLRVGPGTPFLAPGNPAAREIEATGGPFTLAAAGGAASALTFLVDVNATWWRADSPQPGLFTVQIVLNGTNADTGARRGEIVVPATVEVVGFGPNLLPSAVSNGPMVPGQSFQLNVTLRNDGDDVARNVQVLLTAPARTVNLLGDFFDYRRNVTLRIGDFGVGNYKDLVHAEAIAHRALSSPMARVVQIHVDRIGPGETVLIPFELVADPNIVPGATYPEMLTVTFSDSQAARAFTNGPLPLVLAAAGGQAVLLGDAPAPDGWFPSPAWGLLGAVGAFAAAAVVLRRRS